MMEADLVQREVDPPLNRWCACGHEAPAMFKRGGPDSLPEPTRFFQVTGGGDVNAIYCEICLIVSSYLSAQKKKGLIK